MENPLKLNEKTVILFGTLSPLVQSTANLFTELGADVVFLLETEKEGQSMANNLTDLRAAQQFRGRAVSIGSKLSTEREAKDAISNAAHSFGGVDMIIDMNFPKSIRALDEKTPGDAMVDEMQTAFKKSMLLTHVAIPFLKARPRGRLIYVFNDGPMLGMPDLATGVLYRNSLKDFIKTAAADVSAKNMTINGISAGITEEFLLKKFPGGESISKSREGLKAQLPSNRMVDAMDIANAVVFLASPMANAINGQILRVSHALP